MNDEKRKIFEEVLTQPYDHDDFVRFLRELLNNVQLVAPNKDEKPYNTFSAVVDHYNHIGNYIGADGSKIALFSVCLKGDKKAENARSMQRSFIKGLLESGNRSGALAAFYNEGNSDKWRLSLVRLDYEFSKGKISEKLTPAKRYSYLVGKGEPCHTAQERLFPIFESDERNPGLNELEEAFSVEAVTKDFFDKYRDKYLELKEYLDANDDFAKEASSRGFDSEQFAKKLMGQLVFLYFIQKKGWLGVNPFPRKLTSSDYKKGFYRSGQRPKELMPRAYKEASDGLYYRDNKAIMSMTKDDREELSTLVKGDKWGDGPKDFMRKIFDSCEDTGKNFFDDNLEPLFYTGLNQNRGGNAFFAPMNTRIPFLNGGLFEELEGYDWKNNKFKIPNDIFSNKGTKGRDADGILDIFDRYNFTMAEDEPMEREVAIDPEMLGKVFENLLEVSDRKSSGAFYTPREIVHYMCQESLINYLVTRTGIPQSDIRKFVLYGEYFRDDDTKKTRFVRGENGKKDHYEYDKSRDLEIPDTIFSYKKNVNCLSEIDELLANIKVCDPAVGSGAFPLGMLNEIVKARETITTYKTIEMNPYQRLSYRSTRSPYRMKRDTIKNCIFACDLEASATDIAKLRLWLSLVIDDQTMDKDDIEFDYSTKPRELPNLDCNIICGNSLLDEFHGIKLITESDALGNTNSLGRQASLYDSELAFMINELIDLQSRLYDEKDRVAKESLKNQMQEIYNSIILKQLYGSPEAEEAYYESLKQTSKPFVLWQLYFPKVFRDNGGFDVVIGNPPYIQLQKAIEEGDGNMKLGDLYVKSGFKTFTRTGDIYCLFYEKGFELLRDGGVLCYITSNKWMRAGYGEKLRAFFAKNTDPALLIDFAGQKIFESATVDTNILLFIKSKNKELTRACIAGEKCKDNLSVYVEQHSTSCAFTGGASWVILSPIEQSIKKKIEAAGVPLKDWDISINYGIKTGCNEAFIIDGAKKDELIAKDPKSAEIIRPILRGRDIKRYGYEFADLWLIATFPAKHYNINDYPAVKNYLLSYAETDLRSSGLDWIADGYLNEYCHQKLSQTGKTIRIGGKEIRIKGKTDKARKKTSNKWFETQDSIGYWEDFSKQKIVWKRIGSKLRFSYDGLGCFSLDSTCIITGHHIKYLTAILNTYIGNYILKNSPKTGTGDLIISVQALDPALIPIPNTALEEQIESLMDGLTRDKSQYLNNTHIEEKIENIFRNIYGLSDAEYNYIIEFSKSQFR